MAFLPAAWGAAGVNALADSALARAVLADARFQQRLTDPGSDWRWKWFSGDLKLPFLDLALPMWVPFAALALAVLVFALMRVLRLRGIARDAGTGAAAGSGASSPTRTLAMAQALADRGAHSEAMHLLLLVALDHWSGMSAVGAGQTSREVLRTLPVGIQGERRAALADLVRAVEWTWFGGRGARAADYERALGSCRAFIGIRS